MLYLDVLAARVQLVYAYKAGEGVIEVTGVKTWALVMLLIQQKSANDKHSDAYTTSE